MTDKIWFRCLIGWHKYYWTHPTVYMPLSKVDVKIRRGFCQGPGCRASKEVLPRELPEKT
jgi:hypothetical protein